MLLRPHSDRYSYYNVGGIAVELYYHAMRTGLLNLILILFGLWLCVKRKKPSLPVLALCELMLSMLLFTRVQNSGSHQMLLYVPAYVILFLCGAAGLAERPQRRDGYLYLSDRPGIGVDFDEKLAAKYPCKPGAVSWDWMLARLPDGTSVRP